MGRRQLSCNYADSSPDCRLKLCEKCVWVPTSGNVCTSGAQGLLSIGSVWLNVKNCGFLPGASLSGSLPCLHFLNTPLFLNLLQVFGQDAKTTHTGPEEQDFSPHRHLSNLLSSRPGSFFLFFPPLPDARIKRLSLIMGQSYVMCFLFGHLLFNLRLVLFVGPFWKWKALYIPDSGRGEKRDYCHKDYHPSPPPTPSPLLRRSPLFRGGGDANRNLFSYCTETKEKKLVLSCQSCWHMKDWTLFKKKKEWKTNETV